MTSQAPTTKTLPRFNVERFLHLSRQVVSVGVREEVRVYQLVTGPIGQARATLKPALASLLAKSPEQWRQIANCFDESLAVEPVLQTRWEPIGRPLRRVMSQLTPGARTTLVMAVAMLCLGGGMYRLWPNPPVVEMEDSVAGPVRLPSPQKTEVARVIEDKPARTTEERSRRPIPIPKRPWLVLCALMSFLVALGIRWMLLPRTLRRLQMKSQREAEAALAKEAREKGQLLRPSYRVEPIPPVSRSVAEDCATLLGRLREQDRGVELDVLQTMNATIRAGGRFAPTMLPRRTSGEALVLIDDEGRDHPWLSTIVALVELWKRQGVRLSVYTYGNPFPHYLDPYPRTKVESIALSEVAREHGGAALLVFSRRLSIEGFSGEADWTKELEPFPQRAWIDPDPRPMGEIPARVASISAIEEHRLFRYPLTDEGVLAAVRQLVTEHKLATSHDWPTLSHCRSEKEQLALRLWATAAALVPDATWDQVLALRVGLPEISQVFPAPDVRPMQRLLEWVRTESGENPEKHVDRLFLAPRFQDALVAELRKEDGGPTKAGSFEQRVHQILLGQLGEAPRAGEQQSGRGRLVWELKVAMHRALLMPKHAKELLRPFIGTGVESLLSVYVRGERERQKGRPIFSRGTWTDLGVMTEQEGRVAPSDLVLGHGRLWVESIGAGLALGALLSLPVLVNIPKVSQWVAPNAEQVTEREEPADSHVERIAPVVEKKAPPFFPPAVAIVPEKPPKVPESPQRPGLVWIAPGTFMMGSAVDDPDHLVNEPRHPVRLTKGYYLMETEVTQGQYKTLMGVNPAADQACKAAGVGTRLAVHCVDFYDAVRYANVLSGVERLEKCYVISGEKVGWPKKHGCAGYRLPTEAEWEYAAKAGKAHKYAGGNEPGEYAWYDRNSENRVHAVKTRRPNGWGLFDMSGNVWEWTWDAYTDKPQGLPRTDPLGGDGSFRVFRGGSWSFDARSARVAYRYDGVPDHHSTSRGFRLARSFP